MAIQKLFSVLFLHLALAFLLVELTNAGGLQLGFHRRACPDAELIVHETLHGYISRDPTLAALIGTQNRKHYLCTRIIIDDGG